MSQNNSATKSDWVRLNVGGKAFQTTKCTLSRYLESFLARLVNGDLPSEKDESGAYLIDGNPEHFETILTYLRRGVLNLSGDEKSTKDLLCEADFYNIQPLVDEIRKAMRPVINLSEAIMLFVNYYDNEDDECKIVCSEKHDDYEVLQALQALRNQFESISGNNGEYGFFKSKISGADRMALEMVLRNFDFVEESYDGNFYQKDGYQMKYWKFVRNVTK